MAKDTEYSDSDNKYSVMHPLIYLEDSYDKKDGHVDSPRKPPSSKPSREPINPSKKCTEEPNLAPDPGTLPEPSAHTREDNKGNIYTGYIIKYQKGSYLPRLATLEERTKESPWGDI